LGKKNIHLFSNLTLKINEYGFLSARHGFLLHAAQPVTSDRVCAGVCGLFVAMVFGVARAVVLAALPCMTVVWFGLVWFGLFR
jgi:hypothetical protein